MVTIVRLSRRVADIIHHAARAAMPDEACGLLFGSDDAVTDAIETRNVAERPECRFEIDPAALFAALRVERGGGRTIAGYWHSHPSGNATPSSTDAAMAAPDGRLWLIAASGEIAAWRAVADGAVHGRFDAVDLRIA